MLIRSCENLKKKIEIKKKMVRRGMKYEVDSVIIQFISLLLSVCVFWYNSAGKEDDRNDSNDNKSVDFIKSMGSKFQVLECPGYTYYTIHYTEHQILKIISAAIIAIGSMSWYPVVVDIIHLILSSISIHFNIHFNIHFINFHSINVCGWQNTFASFIFTQLLLIWNVNWNLWLIHH